MDISKLFKVSKSESNDSIKLEFEAKLKDLESVLTNLTHQDLRATLLDEVVLAIMNNETFKRRLSAVSEQRALDFPVEDLSKEIEQFIKNNSDLVMQDIVAKRRDDLINSIDFKELTPSINLLVNRELAKKLFNL